MIIRTVTDTAKPCLECVVVSRAVAVAEKATEGYRKCQIPQCLRP